MNSAALGPGNAVPRNGTGPRGVSTPVMLPETVGRACAVSSALTGVTDRVRACSMLIGPPDRVGHIARERTRGPTWPREAPGYRIRTPLDLSEVNPAAAARLDQP